MKKSESINGDVIQDWSLQITRVDNGYYLVGIDGEKFVIEEKPDDKLHEHEQLLFMVREYFDFQGSKHDKERIVILRQPQDE